MYPPNNDRIIWGWHKVVSQGEANKAAGLEQVAANNLVWLTAMRKVAKAVAAERGYVCADDLRNEAKRLRKKGILPSHPNAWGALFKTQSFVIVGHVISRHPSNHARRIALWRLA